MKSTCQKQKNKLSCKNNAALYGRYFNMNQYRKKIGDWGEDQACLFLQRHGFFIVERNYHTVFGEIDIVASKKESVYFVEVKTRKDRYLANDQSITYGKKIKLQKSVRAYCYSRNILEDRIILAGLIIEVDSKDKMVRFNFYIMV